MPFLLRDIPKWLAWLKEASVTEWKQFLEQPIVEGHRPWNLSTLKEMAETAPHLAEDTEDIIHHPLAISEVCAYVRTYIC